MKVVCSYCLKILPEKEPFEDKRTSHGICKDCLTKELKKIEAKEDEA